MQRYGIFSKLQIFFKFFKPPRGLFLRRRNEAYPLHEGMQEVDPDVDRVLAFGIIAITVADSGEVMCFGRDLGILPCTDHVDAGKARKEVELRSGDEEGRRVLRKLFRQDERRL